MSASAATVLAGVLALGGALAALWVQQHNRHTDRRNDRWTRDTTARVDETRLALEAWKDIVESLRDEVVSVRERAERCEDVTVPALEKKVSALQDRVTTLEGGR